MKKRLRAYSADGSPGNETGLRADGLLDGDALIVPAGGRVAIVEEDGDVQILPIRFDRTMVVKALR